jgi:hypothetical protein
MDKQYIKKILQQYLPNSHTCNTGKPTVTEEQPYQEAPFLSFLWQLCME